MAPEGVIIGGWSFVIAAYTVTAVGLLLFAWSLRRRLRASERKEDDG